jgi:excinuclease ABC subunit C
MAISYAAMIEPIFDSKSFLATLTDAPGVYRMLDAAGAVL